LVVSLVSSKVERMAKTKGMKMAVWSADWMDI
jgi:hypothetical protein